MQVVDLDEEIAKAESQIEDVGGPDSVRELHFQLLDFSTGNMVERVYFQEELGVFPKQKFITLMTSEINQFVKGEYGVKIGELFRGDLRQKMPTEINEQTVTNVVEENSKIIETVIEVINRLPDLQTNIIALSLGVPTHEFDWFRKAIQEPPRRGGLTDDEFVDILKFFMRQNVDALRRFFTQKAVELVDEFRLTVMGEQPEEAESETSEPSTPMANPPTSPGSTPSTTSSQPTPASV